MVLSTPLRAVDLLPADTPVQPLGARRITNPGIRMLIFLGLLVAAIPVVLGLSTFINLDSFAAFATIQLVLTIVGYLILVLAVERRRPPHELDLRRAPGILLGFFFGAMLFLVCYGAIWALGGYRITGVGVPEGLWFNIFVMGLVAGVSEEILLRGILFRLTEELVGTWGAAAVSAVVFGALHLGNPGATWWGALAIAIEAGTLFAVVYALTRSLWVVMGIHAAWNIVQGPILGLSVSGTGPGQGLLRQEVVGPVWLTGGSFGPEASYVTVGILTVVTVAVGICVIRQQLVVLPRWTRRRIMRDALPQAPATAP